MTPYLTDSDWLDLHHRDDIDEYLFSYRVAEKIKHIDRPTQRQINQVRFQVLKEMTPCTTAP